MKTSLLAPAAALALAAAPASAAVNLVTNGGFETGDFTGWTQFGNTGFTGVSGGIEFSGDFAAFFGPVGSRGGIRQTLATVAGETYRLRFVLQNNSPDPVNRFGVFLDGITQLAVINSPAFPYTLYEFEFTALDGATTLAFSLQHDPSFYYLDDVSFALVPEPATWGMMIAGFGIVGLGLRRRRTVVAA